MVEWSVGALVYEGGLGSIETVQRTKCFENQTATGQTVNLTV